MWKRGGRLRKIRVFGCEKRWGKKMERIGLCGKLRISTEGATGNVLTQGKTSLLGVDVDGDVLDGLGEARVVLELRFNLLERMENGGVIASAELAADVGRGEIRHAADEVHGGLTGGDGLAAAGGSLDHRLVDAEKA